MFWFLTGVNIYNSGNIISIRLKSTHAKSLGSHKSYTRFVSN